MNYSEWEFQPVSDEVSEAMDTVINSLVGVVKDEAKVRRLNCRLLLAYIPKLKPDAQNRAARTIVHLLRQDNKPAR